MSFDAEVEVGVKKDNGALSEKDKQEETMCRAVPDDLGGKEEKEEETFGSDKEIITPMGSISQKSKSRCPDLWRASSIVSTYLNVEEDVFHSDMENWRPKVLRDLKLNEPTYENVVKSERDDEMFGSDKENLTSGISSDQKMKEKSCKMLRRSPFNTITASNMVDSDKENRTPEIPREMKVVAWKEIDMPQQFVLPRKQRSTRAEPPITSTVLLMSLQVCKNRELLGVTSTAGVTLVIVAPLVMVLYT
ncbi:hypothetical protein COCNU_scaffold000856G000010 [Cocos nucifera]|nr:hypothetical protein [Cocos nucifera]